MTMNADDSEKLSDTDGDILSTLHDLYLVIIEINSSTNIARAKVWFIHVDSFVVNVWPSRFICFISNKRFHKITHCLCNIIIFIRDIFFLLNDILPITHINIRVHEFECILI